MKRCRKLEYPTASCDVKFSSSTSGISQKEDSIRDNMTNENAFALDFVLLSKAKMKNHSGSQEKAFSIRKLSTCGDTIIMINPTHRKRGTARAAYCHHAIGSR